MYTASDAIAKLDTLGSPRQIADHLLERGCAGWPSEKDRCPVARFVAVETLTSVIVAEWGWWPDAAGLPEAETLPVNVAGFVADFDAGVFPELICAEFEASVRREQWEAAQAEGIPEDRFKAWLNGEAP